jgi:uncharacterized protein (TIGR00730 family)
MKRNIAVFCGSSMPRNPEIIAAARELGRRLAEEGDTLVYGGSNLGLMGVVSGAALEAGGFVVGIIPTLFSEDIILSQTVTELVRVRTMAERKERILEMGDAFISLPGGIGTIDEIFTVVASATIGYHQKTLILYNMKGFWDSLMALLDDLQAKGMVRGNWRDYIKTADSIEDLSTLMAGI